MAAYSNAHGQAHRASPFLLAVSLSQEENADCGSEMRAGLEWHPSSKWDLYVYGGDEYYGRAAYVGRHNAVDKIVE